MLSSFFHTCTDSLIDSLTAAKYNVSSTLCGGRGTCTKKKLIKINAHCSQGHSAGIL